MDNEVITRIAQKIKTARLQKGFTIQQVSTKSNVSKGLLSKIENSRTIPSLPVFVSLLQSLDISFKDFFEDMLLRNGMDYWHIKKESYTEEEKERRTGFQYLHIISQNIPSCILKISILKLEPMATGRPTTTDGYEFKYIIEGNCDYNINNTILNLKEGDSLYFDASKPHLPINASGKKVLMLVAYFLFPK